MKHSINDRLNNKLVNELGKVIASDSVVLLDVPNYYNPGDQLIWEGEIELLKQLDKTISYVSSLHFFNPRHIGPSDTILMQGGGNFGDLYIKHLNFRKQVVNSFPNNQIVILPVTVHFSSEEHLQQAGEYFSQHQHVTICARDKHSYDLLTKYFDNPILLLPDTAFAIRYFKKKIVTTEQPKILYMDRTDKENSKNFVKDEFDFLGEYDVSDWPSYKYLYWSLFLHLFFLYLNRLILFSLNIFGLHWNKKYDIYGLLKFHSKEDQINRGIEFLSRYDLIITTRLHGHIAACLLEIPNILLDNSYGKNKNFYLTWMKDNQINAFYAQSTAEIKNIVKKLS